MYTVQVCGVCVLRASGLFLIGDDTIYNNGNTVDKGGKVTRDKSRRNYSRSATVYFGESSIKASGPSVETSCVFFCIKNIINVKCGLGKTITIK